MTAENDFDLLTQIECFLRRGPDSEWGTAWHVHSEHADEFEAYLRIIGAPFRRELAFKTCGCSRLPAHRCYAYFHYIPFVN